MAQHDYVIANDTAANVRSDINGALAAIASNNSAATAPATTYANQWWYDTSTDILKIRAEANDAWINVAYLDQATDQFFPFVGGVALTATGTELNVLDGITATTAELNVLDGITGMASQAVAEAGTDNATLMTPLRVAQAIDAQAASGGVTAVSAQAFTAPGTWTKPASVKLVKVTVVAAGGGQASSPGPAGSAASGDGGGAIKYVPGPSMPGPVSITVGAGVSGGTGGSSSFGPHASATGGTTAANGAGTGGDINRGGLDGGLGFGGGLVFRPSVPSPSPNPFTYPALTGNPGVVFVEVFE
jgi:hypothetical protein